MSRYSQFDEQPSITNSVAPQQDSQQPICITSLLSQPNPLMDKIQFTPYQAKNYYPVQMCKLPQMINTQEYYMDNNNMILMQEAAFAHEKMKKEIAKCVMSKKTIQRNDLLTLGELYASKSLIYQKLPSSSQGSYFATFTLNMGRMQKHSDKTNRHKFNIRSTRTPLLSQRSKTERVTPQYRSKIEFNSNFESGNLYKVFQRQYNQYDLILQNDINTKGNNQWFFFSVRNVPKNTTIKFNIVNMSKKYSLFEYGMKPAVFSMARYERRQIGWVRDGTKVNYRQSSQLRRQTSNAPYYTLSFEYKFNYDGDIVYFSYSIPYTFTNLCSFLSKALVNKMNSKKVRVRNLGQTLGGNTTTLFQLTNIQSRLNKKSIWIIGRQHSGQVTSSFMVEGIINYLLSQQQNALYLMNHYVFRIVPMLNIDGVVHGNSRADLSGHDSNRKWTDPHPIYQPVLYAIKKMIANDNVQMVLDLHSHSRKLGTFFYCNNSSGQSVPKSGLSANAFNDRVKVFAMMVCRQDDRFDYRSNRYRGGNNLTLRRVLYQMLDIPYIYTIQSSLFGYQKQQDYKIIPYQPNDYREMGQSVLKVFAQMNKKRQLYKPIDQRLLLCCQQQLQQQDNIWQQMNQADQIQSIGSDQDPGADQLSKKQLDVIFERKNKKVVKGKKKKEQSRNRLRKKIVQQVKKQEDKMKSKDSMYKKLFSGRMSLQSKSVTTALDFYKRPKPQMKHFYCQVQIHQKAVLHRSSLNVQTSRDHPSFQKIFERNSLCVVGQKVEDEVVINGNSVGVQTEIEKSFLKPRNEMMAQNKSLSKRLLKSTPKVSTILLHNDNNFLNRGDILHKAMRMLNNRW